MEEGEGLAQSKREKLLLRERECFLSPPEGVSGSIGIGKKKNENAFLISTCWGYSHFGL